MYVILDDEPRCQTHIQRAIRAVNAEAKIVIFSTFKEAADFFTENQDFSGIDAFFVDVELKKEPDGNPKIGPWLLSRHPDLIARRAVIVTTDPQGLKPNFRQKSESNGACGFFTLVDEGGTERHVPIIEKVADVRDPDKFQNTITHWLQSTGNGHQH